MSSSRPVWLSNNEDARHANALILRRGSLTDLMRNSSYGSLHNLHTVRSGTDHAPPDIEAGLRSAEEELGKLLKDERRMSQILQGNPSGNNQSRSLNLIGRSNPRYRWETYWKRKSELKAMKKPLRRYYERTNTLIEQYMYIDCLLDSAIPYEILDEYSTQLEASAFAVPETIQEEGPPLANASSSSTATESRSGSEDPSSEDTVNTPAQKKLTPQDIFRSSETMPLLQKQNAAESHNEDAHDGSNPRSSSDSIRSGPRPNLPWLEDAELDSDNPIVTWAVLVNMIANAILLAGKIAVVVSVPSLSVLASLVDAVLDFLSTAIVWTTTRLISSSQQDQHQYPVGRRRLEPVGVLVFSIVMITSFAQVALECIQTLAGDDHTILELGIPAIAIMIGTIVVKGACWLWCRLIKNSSVRALADDAATDVIFNTGSILFPIVGFYARVWWLDALGGLLLSLIVMVNWSKTSAHHVRNLTGFSAQPDERNLLLYLTMRFATSIRKIQNLRAYHAGDKLFVEVDIVLLPNTPLKDSHDLSEVLTYFLESVPIVDRAFVHVDYVSYHAPTHMLK